MDYDHPGRFLDFFSEDGIVPEMVRLWEGQEIPNLAPYDFLFVLGGAQDTWQEEHTWMPAEKAAIREWVWDRAKPYFGVCLGHQLLCDALGGEVALAAEPEVGVYDVHCAGWAGAWASPELKTATGDAWHWAEVTRRRRRRSSSHVTGAIRPLPLMTTPSAQFHCEFTPQTMATWSSLPGYLLRWKKMAQAPIAGLHDEATPPCRRWRE